MKGYSLTILYNDHGDYLLFINGESYHDIHHTWAECMVFLGDVLKGFSVELKHTDLERKDFPDYI